MRPAEPKLVITTAPFVRAGPSTRGLMFEVLAATLPVAACAAYFFGLAALLIVASALAGAVVGELLLVPSRPDGRSPLRDGSALLTGVLLGLTLPPTLAMWMAFLGGLVAIGLGKAMWGGLGQNVFNPALVGRAFLQAAFPQAMTTWADPAAGFLAVPASVLAPPFFRASVDVVSAASPLGLAKFEHTYTDLGKLFAGSTAGSLGETSAALLILVGLWLGARRVFDWRLPLATVAAVAAASGLLHLANPATYPHPLFMVLSGGLLFGAVFMVTDPVTTPITPRGAWVYGAGVGCLVVLIRLFGGLPEGVMYSILLMNAATPHINRGTQPRRFGG